MWEGEWIGGLFFTSPAFGTVNRSGGFTKVDVGFTGVADHDVVDHCLATKGTLLFHSSLFVVVVHLPQFQVKSRAYALLKS